MSAFYRLNPKVDVLSKVVSGGNNENWIKASYDQCKQMKIMLGELSMDEIMTDDQGKPSIFNHPFQFINIQTFKLTTIKTGNRHYGPPPPWFDPSILATLDRAQIAWWDECHIEQEGGKWEIRCINTHLNVMRMVS